MLWKDFRILDYDLQNLIQKLCYKKDMNLKSFKMQFAHIRSDCIIRTYFFVIHNFHLQSHIKKSALKIKCFEFKVKTAFQ